MGLNHHAQGVVDQHIAELWAAFKAGYTAAGPDQMYAEKDQFKVWLELQHPDLAGYFDAEKLV